VPPRLGRVYRRRPLKRNLGLRTGAAGWVTAGSGGDACWLRHSPSHLITQINPADWRRSAYLHVSSLAMGLKHKLFEEIRQSILLRGAIVGDDRRNAPFLQHSILNRVRAIGD
jgi:hypothetical protein